MTSHSAPTLVIGAGLAGLSCAVRLYESGHPVTLFDASDSVGGRVRTDEVEGFLLDRGFQVFLDAYPEACRFLDTDDLRLKRFESGALIWKNGRLRPVMDVFRYFGALASTAAQPVGTIKDKLLVGKLRIQLMRKSLDRIWAEAAGQTTESFLRKYGFSDAMIDTFFRSFYGGIFLERDLSTDRRMFEFTFKLFSQGHATVPALGMQKIPEQLVSRLPKESIHLGTPIRDVLEDSVLLDNGEAVSAHSIVIATDGETARQWVPELPEIRWQSTANLYFRMPEPYIERPIIVLNGEGVGVVNHVCEMTTVSPNYTARRSEHLMSVSILGTPAEAPPSPDVVVEELRSWFGDVVDGWRHLRTYVIQKALPSPVTGHQGELFLQPRQNLYVCGDHLASGSIEGAITSGLRTADAILKNG